MTTVRASILVATHATPPFVIVDPATLLPRYWATAWSVGTAGTRLANNTVRVQLRHVEAFYRHCDELYGAGSLDDALSRGDSVELQWMFETFYQKLKNHPSSTSVQCWDAVRSFLRYLFERSSVQSESHRALLRVLQATGRISNTSLGRFKFTRALPDETLNDLLQLAHPASARNPFRGEGVRWRNWLILNLLLLAGLRRGEALLLRVDALKQDVDRETGEWIRWLNVTTTEDEDDRSTKPSIKTRQSHRQIPVSEQLAALFERYVFDFREPGDHAFLLTARGGLPLSAESIEKIFDSYTSELSESALIQFRAQVRETGSISPHDLRHTCATARYKRFMALQPDRELAFQRMRAFFGWSSKSEMPELYARSAIEYDLIHGWDDEFAGRLDTLRSLK